jgi:hypothetical protein
VPDKPGLEVAEALLLILKFLAANGALIKSCCAIAGALQVNLVFMLMRLGIGSPAEDVSGNEYASSRIMIPDDL